MHTEHLQNVRPARVVAGWLVAVAVTSLILLTFAAVGLLDAEGATGGTLRSIAAMAAGFLVGGWFTGSRTIEAPILHGAAIGLTSLLGWFIINAVVNFFFPSVLVWEALTPSMTVLVLALQMLAAIVGALLGYNMALRGRVSLKE
jgi:hypothetical protein